MASLFQLTGAYLTLATADESADYDLAIKELEQDIKQHAEGIALAIRMVEAGSEAIEREMQRLSDLKRVRDNRARDMRDFLLAQLQAVGMKRVDGTLVQVFVQQSPPAVRVADGTILPPEYTRIVPARAEPDKKALLEAYKTGVAMPEGVSVVQANHLRVK